MLTEIADICPDCFSFRYQESGCPDCGYRVPEPGKEGPALPVRTMLLNGRYMVGKVIGIGGCGITYKAFDMLYREVCAIKEFMPQGLAGRVPGSRDLQVYRASDQAAYRHGLERFIQEARILKRLKAEPAIVQVKACFTEDKTAYLVMGYLDGQDLRQAAKEGRIGARKAIGIVTEIGKVMGVVHANGILHRDISPENIFLLKDDRVKILDFGSARQQILKGRQEYSVQFKQGFAPPEQYSRTGEQGPYTDVYGLASTCYYILTGCMIPDAMERLQEKAYIPLIRLCPEAGQAVSDAVDRALEPDYRRRTQTMEAFVADLWGRGQILPAGPAGMRQKTAETAPAQRQDGVVPAPGAAGGSRQSTGCIRGISGIYQGAALRLDGSSRLRIGRDSASCGLVIPDPKISRVHCEIRYDQQACQYILQDCSTNGTFLEGGPQIGQSQAVVLPSGTRIRLGTTENVFLLQ